MALAGWGIDPVGVSGTVAVAVAVADVAMASAHRPIAIRQIIAPAKLLLTTDHVEWPRNQVFHSARRRPISAILLRDPRADARSSRLPLSFVSGEMLDRCCRPDTPRLRRVV